MAWLYYWQFDDIGAVTGLQAELTMGKRILTSVVASKSEGIEQGDMMKVVDQRIKGKTTQIANLIKKAKRHGVRNPAKECYCD
jgi:hypothetical protein